MADPDTVVVGGGPNGLTAAAVLARAGRRVVVIERSSSVGGGVRTDALTLDGFRHDVCSAVHPMAAASPVFADLDLAAEGLDLIVPDVQLAHPLGGDRAAALVRSVDATAEGLGVDGRRYERWIRRPTTDLDAVLAAVLRPLPSWLTEPPHDPASLARVVPRIALPSTLLARVGFRTVEARALLAGLAAHTGTSLSAPSTSMFALVLAAAAHTVGWPVPRGGAQSIADSLVAIIRRHGGEIVTGGEIRTLDELPDDADVLLDLSTEAVLELAGHRLPPRYCRALRRYRRGPGVFKVDYALAGPVPWEAEACRRSVTVHVGGTMEEIAASERSVADGAVSARPFVLVAQPGVVDPSRAPAGCQSLWAYCHVPNGYDGPSLGERIDRQIEHFAPGFRDLILARCERGPVALEAMNPNLLGGDVNGGANDLRQVVARPTWRRDPYTTPHPRLFICSASTPPGGGVHGMCGWGAARAVLAAAREDA